MEGVVQKAHFATFMNMTLAELAGATWDRIDALAELKREKAERLERRRLRSVRRDALVGEWTLDAARRRLDG